jgi:hypothetical protein
LNAFLERTAADELMVTAQIFDPQARERSYALLAKAVGLAPTTPQLETAA